MVIKELLHKTLYATAIPYKVKSRINSVEEGEVIALNGIELKVLHTPGHTPGGISLLMQKPKEKIVFTGLVESLQSQVGNLEKSPLSHEVKENLDKFKISLEKMSKRIK